MSQVVPSGSPSSPAPEQAVPHHPPGYRPRRARNWFFLGLMYASYYLCRRNLTIAAPEFTKEFAFSNAQYGKINTARDGGYAIGQFINGLFTDRLGGKQAMAIGAIGTIFCNVAFGLVSTSHIGWLLMSFILLRTLDGYLQAFGAPGMVKINTSWFQHRERGRFAGIFGGMIQLGDVGVGQLGFLLLNGFAIPLIGLHVAKQNWRSMFFVPPAITLVVLIFMWLNVKNHPEEAGYTIRHDDDEHSDNVGQSLPVAYVFKKIASNPIAWINAGAYFCTGFVRAATSSWWTKYMDNFWHVDKSSSYFIALAWSLPLAAFVGSFSSGFLSDTLFRGRRGPIAALLYALETAVIILTIIILGRYHYGDAPDIRIIFGHSVNLGPLLAVILLTAIAVTCNSTHSIIGTAAAMDLGGRKMAGFASGVIDSFQYFGAMLAGWTLGMLIDQQTRFFDPKTQTPDGWISLFYAMLPFSILGGVLMLYIYLTTRGRDVKGS